MAPDEKPSEEDKQAARESAGARARELSVTFTGKKAEEALDRLNDPEETRKQGRYKIEKDAAEQAHQFRRIAAWFIFIIASIPPVLLAALGGSVFFGDFRVFADFVNNAVGPWPIGAFVAGVFASFIAVFGFLAKGAFSHSRRKDDEEESLESAARGGRSVAQNGADKGG